MTQKTKVTIEIETIEIAGVEVPKPIEEGCIYYVPFPADGCLMVDWVTDCGDKNCLKANMAHETINAATRHAYALILASGGEPGFDLPKLEDCIAKYE